MSRVKFSIDPDVLDWAISKSSLDNEFIEDRLSEFPIKDWKSGRKDPTVNQLGNFSKKLQIPFGYLFLSSVPKNRIPAKPAFRTIENHPATLTPNLREVIGIMRTRRDWMRNDLIAEDDSPVPFIGQYKDESSIDKLSQKVRELLDLSKIESIRDINKFFTSLRNSLMLKRILIMMDGTVNGNTKRPLSLEDDARAFVLLDDYAPLIFINSKDSYNGKVFSLLHEFIHILRGSDDVLVGDREVEEERFINKVVAEVLIPKNKFIHDYYKYNIQELSSIYHASKQTIIYRANELSLIDNYEKGELIKEHTDQPKTSGKGGDYWRTVFSRIDLRFSDVVLKSFESGDTATTEAANLLGVTLHSFYKFKEKYQERY